MPKIDTNTVAGVISGIGVALMVTARLLGHEIDDAQAAFITKVVEAIGGIILGSGVLAGFKFSKAA